MQRKRKWTDVTHTRSGDKAVNGILHAGGTTKVDGLLEGFGGAFFFSDFHYDSNAVCSAVRKDCFG